jgi:O-antigen ligase
VPLLVTVALAGLRSPVTVVFAFYAALVPMGSVVDLPVPLPSPFDTVSSLAGVVAGAALLVEVLIWHRTAPTWTRALPWFLAFVGWSATTVGWSLDRSATAHDAALLASLVLIYAVAGIARTDRVQLDRIGSAIEIGAVVASVVGVLLLATGHGTNGDLGAPRLALTGDDPNHTAAALLLPFLIAAGRTLGGGRRRLLTHGPAAAAIFVAITLTGSRGGVVALVVGVVVLAVSGPSVRVARPLLVVLALGTIAGIAVAPAQLEARLADPSSTGRTTIWRLGLESCDRYCVQGSGWGSFPVVYQQEFRADPQAGGYRTGAFRAHNIWLQAWVETGLVGLGLLLGGFAVVSFEVWALPPADRAVPAAALASLVVASALVSNMTFKYFWLVLTFSAMAASAHRVSARRVAVAEGPDVPGTLVAAGREG